MILAWISVACLIGAAFLCVRRLIDRYDSLGRKKPFPWISVVGLVAAAIAGLVPFFLRVRLENELVPAVPGRRLIEIDPQAAGDGLCHPIDQHRRHELHASRVPLARPRQQAAPDLECRARRRQQPVGDV